MLKCLRELDLIRTALVVIVFLPLIPANGGCHVKNSSKNPCNLMPRIGLVLWVSRVQVSHPCMAQYIGLDLSHMSFENGSWLRVNKSVESNLFLSLSCG